MGISSGPFLQFGGGRLRGGFRPGRIWRSRSRRREWRHYHRVAHAYFAHHRGYAVARRPAPVEADAAFSAIVVDANSGRELYGVNENGLRHPASITKVMTLYLLFEQLDKGALTLQSQIPISEHAAAQAPSKLGISAGDSLSVDEAIKAVVTRSANDVAVAIAEAIGGDESNFAQMMTRKAHALGMSRTIYRNASGLPNDEQITTARDLTVLARATEERFPKYFHYFSTHEFDYAGEIIGNHNHLLGRVDGVDGIKTGYTRASGFNLLTSVHRDGRSLVAVVMGGRTSGARDRMMEQLIADHIAEASTGGHTATMIADNELPAANAAPCVAPPVAQGGRSTPVVAANAPAPPARPAPEQKGEGDNTSEDDEDSAPRAPILPKIVARPTVTPVVASEPPRSRAHRRVRARPHRATHSRRSAGTGLGEGARRRAGGRQGHADRQGTARGQESFPRLRRLPHRVAGKRRAPKSPVRRSPASPEWRMRLSTPRPAGSFRSAPRTTPERRTIS